MAQYEELPQAAPEPEPDARVGCRHRPDEWFYIDTQGAEQGPFPLSSLRAWFQAGYFPGGARREVRVLAKQGLHSEWEPMHGIEAITALELPPEYAPMPAPETKQWIEQEHGLEKENEPEGQGGGGAAAASAAAQRGRAVANGRRAGSAGTGASGVVATKDVHKLFDRATPAGAVPVISSYNPDRFSWQTGRWRRC